MVYAVAINEQDVLDNALASLSLLPCPRVDVVWIYMATPTDDLCQVAGRAKNAIVVHTTDIDELATGVGILQVGGRSSWWNDLG